MRGSLTKGWLLSALLGLAIAFAACSKNTAEDDSPTTGDQAKKEQRAKAEGKTIVLYEYRFHPNTLTISKGTKVTFKNKDQEVHNVKIAALDVDRDLDPGSKWSYTFETTGEFAVENANAESPMKMTVVVEE